MTPFQEALAKITSYTVLLPIDKASIIHAIEASSIGNGGSGTPVVFCIGTKNTTPAVFFFIGNGGSGTPVVFCIGTKNTTPAVVFL